MTASDQALDIARRAAQVASDKKGHDIVAFDVSEQLAITDIFLVISADNDRQVSSVVDAVEEELLKAKVKCVRREGDRDARWVLLDFLDVVVHIQQPQERQLYSLERLWKDCPQIELGIVNPEPSVLGDNEAVSARVND